MTEINTAHDQLKHLPCIEVPPAALCSLFPQRFGDALKYVFQAAYSTRYSDAHLDNLRKAQALIIEHVNNPYECLEVSAVLSNKAVRALMGYCECPYLSTMLARPNDWVEPVSNDMTADIKEIEARKASRD